MFTGIVECLGTVRRVRGSKTRAGVSTFEIETPVLCREVKIGGSVALNGVCLTAVGKSQKIIYFDVMTETKRRSTLGGLGPGDRVNLELPLKLSDRIEGHFVLGHVDAIGRVLRILQGKKEASFLIEFPRTLKPFILEKGSVAVDGVSMTLGKVSRGSFWLHCIPHTLQVTTFGRFVVGSCVNLEADILIKFFKTLK